MTVHVELFGIPRERAGVDKVDVEATDLGDVLDELAVRFPTFAETCLSEGELRSGYLANVNGCQFTRDNNTELTPDTTILILSADAGG